MRWRGWQRWGDRDRRIGKRRMVGKLDRGSGSDQCSRSERGRLADRAIRGFVSRLTVADRGAGIIVLRNGGGRKSSDGGWLCRDTVNMRLDDQALEGDRQNGERMGEQAAPRVREARQPRFAAAKMDARPDH